MNGNNQNPYYRPPRGPSGPGGMDSDARRERSNRRIIRNTIIICVAIALLSVPGIVSLFKNATGAVSGGGKDGSYHGPSQNYLARVPIVGELTSTEDPYASSESSYHHTWTLNLIDDLIADDNNVGLYLYVDTPGGGVYESDELYYKIMDYKELTGRPVFVYMGSMAASGGYYIAAPADAIYANRNTWTGSIGVVIGTLFDVSGFLEQHGVKATNIVSGPNKAMGDYFTPMTEEQRAIMQGLVDEAYMQFVAVVAEGRDLPAEEVVRIADGRIYSAQQALDAGLIDGIERQEDAEDYMLAELPSDTVIEYPSYEHETQLFGGLFGENGLGRLTAAIENVNSGEVSALIEMLKAQKAENGEVPLKYMYEG
ncbi:MAG: signal peptide peptidase SppA [Clostridiales Family XIII bacterium]|jgi:protease-4|nr:signal peptide peptidase SppA [Clostridiales Family XIII bacterium]